MVWENILLGLSNALTPVNLLAMAAGTLIGLFVGAMPGLSATMAIAILLPITFGMDPATGLCMLVSLYQGAMYGGSVSAILIRTPGTPAAAATVIEGYAMAEKGEAGRALGISLWASFVGGIFSGVVLLTVAPILGSIATEFGPIELFGVAVLGMTIIGSLSEGSAIKGLLSGVLGLLLAMIGMDFVSGTPRFTFGVIELFTGLSYTVALIGLFSIPQAIRLVEQDDSKLGKVYNTFTDSMILKWNEIKRLNPFITRANIVGTAVGIIPGTGGDTACWFAYNEAKRMTKDKENFTKGNGECLAAVEASNNAVVGGALIPTITLGIPGSSATAILMGGLMVHGIMPGPTLMTEHAGVTYTMIWAAILSNIFMYVEGLLFTKACIPVTRVKNQILAPIIVMLCVIGSFAINNSIFDVAVMLGFGLIGYFMDKLGIPTAPMVVGLILGQMFDTSLHQSLLIGQGSWMVFITNPICAVTLLLALISVLQATPLWAVCRRAIRRGEADA